MKLLSFIDSEISESENIKDKSTRKSVYTALKKIRNAVLSNYPLYGGKGVAVFSDGEDVMVKDYDGVSKTYHCGKEYISPEKSYDFK